MPPHQARSPGEARHRTLGVAVTAVNPACRAQDSSRRPGRAQVQRLPVVKLGNGGKPGVRGAITVARGDQAARLADPAHLAQRMNRVADVLRHLVGVHDVERGIGEAQCEHIGRG